MTVSIAGFRERFPEFADVPDARVELAIDDAAPEVSFIRWGVLYERGIYNLAAHLLKLSTVVSAGGSVDSLAPVASRSVGDVSVTFATGSGLDDSAGGYNSTPYGREYFRLRKLVSTGGIALV